MMINTFQTNNLDKKRFTATAVNLFLIITLSEARGITHRLRIVLG